MNKVQILDELFLTSDYCVWYEKKNTIIAADFHIGYESALKEDGISLPTFQKEKILDRLADIKNRYHPDSFIVLGDFKHNFGRSENQEFREVLEIMDYIIEDSSLVMIKGNHDNYLENYANMKGVPFYEEKMTLGDINLTHGHSKLHFDGPLIIGHEHPVIQIKDEVGSKMRLPCFLYNPEQEILILPAFDPISEGRDVIRSRSFLSEGLDRFDPAEFQVYAITENGLKDFHTVVDIRSTQPDFTDVLE